MLVFPPSSDPENSNKSRITSALLHVRELISDCKWRFSIGSVADSLPEFTESFFTAKQTSGIIQNLHIHEKVSFYEDWYMHMVLLKEPRRKLQIYMKQSLAPLLDNEELLETLCDYLTFGENLKLTAEHLYIHTNTLKYRLAKISESLACDLKNPNIRFRLRMAITIYRYLKNTE